MGTIAGVWRTGSVGYPGPFLDGNGNLYAIVRDPSSTFFFDVMKSTNGGDNWSQVETASPGITYAIGAISAVQVGTQIHIALIDDFQGGKTQSQTVKYYVYNTSDHGSPDQFSISNETAATPSIGDSSEITSVRGIDIAVRSDGDIIIAHPVNAFTDMGTDFFNVGYSRREGGSWTTNIAFTASASNQFPAQGVMSPSNVYHFVYGDSSSLGRSLSAANSLSTPITIASGGLSGLSRPVIWDPDGTRRVGTWIRRTSFAAGYRRLQESSGVIALETGQGGSSPIDGTSILNENYGIAWDATNSDLYVFFPSTDSDLFMDVAADGDVANFGTDVELVDTVTINGSWANYYDRSGPKIGYIYLNVATFVYAEISLGGGAETIDLTHFDGSATFHSPTVVPSDIRLNHFDGSATFHAPVVAESSIILDLLDPVNFWPPTLADSSVDLDHFDGAATFHEPLFFPIDPVILDLLQTTQFFGPQLDGTIDLNTFDGSATFFAPSFVGVVDLNTFDGSATFFAPEFIGIIDLDTLSTTQFFAISVEGIGIITLDLFDGSATFHQITVQAGVQILDLETFDGAATFHSTFVDGNIDLNTFDGSATFHAPQIDGNIDLAHFDGAATFHEPTLDGEILLDHFDGSATFFAVEVVGQIDLVTFDGSATFHQPAFFDITIQLDHLQTTTFFDITVTTPDVQNLDMDLFDGAATFNSPQLDGNIDLDLLTTTQFFEPQVDGNIDLNLLTTTAFHEPTVGASSIDLEVLDGAASYFAPSFVGVIDLVSADLGAVFHGPTIGGASIDLDPLFTTVFRNITVVDGGAPAPTGFQLPMRGVDR